MTSRRALPWAITLLDDGLRLYRRRFADFVLVGSIVLVPLAVFNLLFTAFVRTQLGEAWLLPSITLASLAQYPVMLYACLALSRTAAGALDGIRVRIGSALRLGPLRALGMGCYGIMLLAVSGTFSSILVVSVACPLLYATVFGAGLLSSAGSGALGAAGVAVGVMVGLILLAILLLGNAMFVMLAYAVQAFALEQRPVGSTISRSLDLLLFRLGRNLLVFVGAGALIGTLLLVYVGTIVAGGLGLFQLLAVELSPLVRDSLASAASTATLVILLPPLPIWMAMLHRNLAEERDAADLVSAVEQWCATSNMEDSAAPAAQAGRANR